MQPDRQANPAGVEMSRSREGQVLALNYYVSQQRLCDSRGESANDTIFPFMPLGDPKLSRRKTDLTMTSERYGPYTYLQSIGRDSATCRTSNPLRERDTDGCQYSAGCKQATNNLVVRDGRRCTYSESPCAVLAPGIELLLFFGTHSVSLLAGIQPEQAHNLAPSWKVVLGGRWVWFAQAQDPYSWTSKRCPPSTYDEKVSRRTASTQVFGLFAALRSFLMPAGLSGRLKLSRPTSFSRLFALAFPFVHTTPIDLTGLYGSASAGLNPGNGLTPFRWPVRLDSPGRSQTSVTYWDTRRTRREAPWLLRLTRGFQGHGPSQRDLPRSPKKIRHVSCDTAGTTSRSWLKSGIT